MSLQDLISHKIEQCVLTEQSLTKEALGRINGLSIRYNANSLEEESFQNVSELAPRQEDQVQWLHWTNLEYCPELLKIFDVHAFHALIAEDILNTTSRIKIEELEESVVISTKIPVRSNDEKDVILKHFCLVLKENCVLSFSEIPLTILADLHRRLASPKRRIRRLGADYLFWAILDVLADYNTLFASTLSEHLDGLEDELIENEKKLTLPVIHATRRRITQFHRMAQPCRDISSRLTRSDSDLITEHSTLFFRDLFDHATQTVETTEYLREQASNLLELYYTTTSHHMNEVMKVLTSVSAIFLPLTFLVGIYGMNFINMPELQYPWAYPVFLIILLLIGLCLGLIFKKKGWF